MSSTFPRLRTGKASDPELNANIMLVDEGLTFFAASLLPCTPLATMVSDGSMIWTLACGPNRSATVDASSTPV